MKLCPQCCSRCTAFPGIIAAVASLQAIATSIVTDSHGLNEIIVHGILIVLASCMAHGLVGDGTLVVAVLNESVSVGAPGGNPGVLHLPVCVPESTEHAFAVTVHSNALVTVSPEPATYAMQTVAEVVAFPKMPVLAHNDPSRASPTLQ